MLRWLPSERSAARHAICSIRCVPTGRLAFVLAAACAVVTSAACSTSTMLKDCSVACRTSSDCGAGQACGADGFCTSPGIAGACGVAAVVDAAAQPPDGAVPASLCAATCPGACDGETCVLDCSAAGSCGDDIQCPEDLACRVVCGDNACGGRILCQKAASCSVQCSGASSCAGDVRCGDGACTVACTGFLSCGRRVQCPDACACDVACSGVFSCHDKAVCPRECDDGRGCTSARATCQQCAS